MSQKILPRVVALLVPPRCCGCAQACAPSRLICPSCERELACLGLPEQTPTITAGFEYAGVARRLVSALKFEHAVGLAGEMAAAMLSQHPSCVGSDDLLVPAPAHPARRRQRGFNQARLLADALAVRSGASVVDCLTRDGSHAPQSELDRAGRLAMPASAIGLRAKELERFAGTNVVVCDDVTTTGVTLELCAQAIRDRHPVRGRASIRGVVFALAAGRGRADRPGKTDRAAGAVAPNADSLFEPPPAVRSTSVKSSK